MSAPRRINLALQGGGAHGAFTWGVLDRLLEDDGIEIAGISGTSAGALNGAALKAGMALNGKQGARDNLDWLWDQVGGIGDLRMASWMVPLMPGVQAWADQVDELLPFSPAEIASRVFSPYAYGSFYRNPLERIVERFHYGHVCADHEPALFISATNVRSGKIRVFSGREISNDVLLASSCLPTVFQAVEIPDPATGVTEAYWDGGYSGNPALFPLFDKALPDDIVIVNINPIVRDLVPTTSNDIQNRINEISFNSSLLRDLRAIAFVKKLIAQGQVTAGAMKDVLVHMIADDALMNRLSAASKLSPTPGLLLQLKAAGRTAADRFMAEHGKDLNKVGTVNLIELYQ